MLGRLAGGWQLSGVTRFESGAPFTVLNGFDADGIGGATERPTFNPSGRKGVRAIPGTDATGRITGYTNPDDNNAPIDPASARYIVTPEKFGQLSSRASQVTEETWTNRDGSAARGWLLRGAENSPACTVPAPAG